MLAGLSLVNIGLTLTLTLSSKDIIHQYKVLLIESTSDCLTNILKIKIGQRIFWILVELSTTAPPMII